MVVYSDCTHVVNGMTEGLADRLQAGNWKLRDQQDAKNVDLWQELVILYQQHYVEPHWVRGHTGNPDNESCDRLATAAARGRNLATDVVCEAVR